MIFLNLHIFLLLKVKIQQQIRAQSSEVQTNVELGNRSVEQTYQAEEASPITTTTDAETPVANGSGQTNSIDMDSPSQSLCMCR